MAASDKLSIPDLLRAFLIQNAIITAGTSSDVSDRVGRLLGHVSVDTLPSIPDGRFLTERMFAKAPQSGWSLWLDTADATNIYIAEAVSSETAGTAATFQGIRVQKDASGNPYGKVQTATNFAWNSRTSAGWA